MKNLILTSVLVLAFLSQANLNSANAQFDSSNYVLPDLREPYTRLDQSRIPSGLLYDRTLNYSDISNYKGNGNKTENADDWLQVYQEMYNSSFNLMPADMESIRQLCEAYFKQGKNPLLIQSFNYNKIKPVAIDSGYLDTLNGYYYDGLVRSSSPYTNEVAFAFTPAYRSFGNNSITFKLAQDLYFSNQATLPSEIHVDFDDGAGWRLLNFGDEVTVNYSNTLERTIQVLVKYPSGVQFTGTAVAKKMDPLLTKMMKKGPIDFKDLEPVEFSSSRRYISGVSDDLKGVVTVKYGLDPQKNKHTCLTKPILIVEGIDFGYPTAWTTCFDGKCGSLGFIDFLTGELNNLLQGTKQAFPEIAKAPEMIKQLNELGYDVLYLDFENGARHIEDNAMILVELIEEINNQKCTDEQLVIIGASMGGVVSRFALSYMEKRNIPHCTRLFISFDAPQKGANVPIGLQCFIKGMQGTHVAFNDAVNRILYRDASKQLLINHVEMDQRDIDRLHTSRIAMLSHLQAEGNYPQKVRMLTIANGSGNGTPQAFSAGAKLWDWSNFLYTMGQIWAAPGVSTGKSYLLVATLQLKLGKEKLFKVHNHGMPALDNAPGGTRANMLGMDFTYKSFPKPKIHWLSQSFIPTISALDYNTNDYFLNIKGAGNVKYNIPFHDYYLQDANQPHILITLTGTPSAPGTGNADWAIQQILMNEDELPAELYSTYNFGAEQVQYLKSVKINNQARLHVNGNYATKFGAGPMTVPGTNFALYTTDCNPVITIAPGGVFEIGDKGSNNKGSVYFRKGSTLNILDGGTLIINNNSSLKIEEGAFLNFYPGAKILLEGNNALLHISGKITVKAGAVFKFEHSPGLSGGYIRFSKESHGELRIACEGIHASIDLHGDYCNDKFMEISNCTVIPDHQLISPLNYFQYVRLHDGLISYLRSSEFKCGSALDVSNVYLKSSGRGLDNVGIHTLGQAQLSLNSITAYGLNIAFAADQHHYGHPFTLSNSRINECTTGVLNSSGSMAIEDCYFKYCVQYAINGFISQHSNINRCLFYGSPASSLRSGIGLSLNCSDYACMIIRNSAFNHCDNAVHMWGSQPRVVASCVNFRDNNMAIDANAFLAELNLSQNMFFEGQNGGNCIFDNNSSGIKINGKLFIENGNNNFYSSNFAAPQFIYADIQFNQPQLSGNNLAAMGNYFSPAAVNSINNYRITYLSPITLHHVIVNLAGTSPVQMANNCSDFNMMEMICSAMEKKSETVRLRVETALNSSNDEAEMSEVQIYPNPASDEIRISGFGNEEKLQIKLFDMSGKCVLELKRNADEDIISIQLPELSTGVYMIEINSESKVLRRLISIQK